MTRITGYLIKVNPCCGAFYSAQRYGSINLSAWSYWTDGYKEGALMPSGHGLRKCKCGNFYLLNELVTICETASADAPSPMPVQPDDLPIAISAARTRDIELAARLNYWHYLNHTYREQYKAHREAEEDAYKTAWEADNPDQRTLWQRFRKAKRTPEYTPAPNRVITYPPFMPTLAQRTNMEDLLHLLATDDYQSRYGFEAAELHRELGQFEEAEKALHTVNMEDEGFSGRLLGDLIRTRQTAVVRYRL